MVALFNNSCQGLLALIRAKRKSKSLGNQTITQWVYVFNQQLGSAMKKIYRRCMNYLKLEFSGKKCPLEIMEYCLACKFGISQNMAHRIVAEYLRENPTDEKITAWTIPVIGGGGGTATGKMFVVGAGGNGGSIFSSFKGGNGR